MRKINVNYINNNMRNFTDSEQFEIKVKTKGQFSKQEM